jgi:hypothetical protein
MCVINDGLNPIASVCAPGEDEAEHLVLCTHVLCTLLDKHLLNHPPCTSPGEDEAEQLACIMELLGPPPADLLATASRRKLFFEPSGTPRITPNSQGKTRTPGKATAYGVSNNLAMSHSTDNSC